MKKNIFGIYDIVFDDENLIINKKKINYSSIDLICLKVPKNENELSKVYSPTHFIIIFLLNDSPLKFSINLSKKQSSKLIENIKKYFRDYIIDYYNFDILEAD